MTIPFLDIFKKVKARFTTSSPRSEAPSAPLPRGVHTEKPSGERLSKTVMPSKSRPAPVSDPFSSQAGAAAPNTRISTDPAQRSAGQKRDLPLVVALALQPKVERAIALQLSDLLGQMPEGFLKPVEQFDPARRVLLKASEVERGMAAGKPSISLTTVYEQVPEIFLLRVPAGDATEVALPYEKVLEQFQNLQVREDQEQEQDVPQVETPILQVTLEDTQRFGTTMTAVQSSAHPPVKVEPATAQTLSSAEPEGIVHETSAPRKIGGFSLAPPVTLKPAQPPPPAAPRSGAPTRIPFHLPPNGAGVPVSETVPASSGPPVPNLSPKKPGPAPGPVRLPFKVSPPSDALRPKRMLVPGVERPEPPEAEPVAAPVTPPKNDGVKVSLNLRAILQNLPVFQFTGSAEAVPAEARVELPFSLIESQLASGRVGIPPKTLQAAMPEQFRGLIVIDDGESPVLLPLQEVLKNLPDTALQMRPDQEVIETGEIIETPFSIKAAEDAKRLQEADRAKTEAPETRPPESDNAPSAVPPATAESPQAVEKVEVKAEAEPAPASAPTESKVKIEGAADQAPASAEAPPKAEEKKSEPKPEAKNEAKQVVEKATALPGVAGCSVTFADGLSLAGNLPAEVGVDGLCAMAPSLLQRIDRHMLDTKLGPLTSMTLHCANSPVTFFMKGDVCLTVLHDGGDLASETQETLAEMAKELSRTYSQPETAHVDH